MKLSEGYSLRKLHDTFYIIPYGQHVASHRKSIQLNETSAFLLNAIIQGVKREALSSLLMSHINAEIDQQSSIQEDVDQFISQMIALNIIYDTPSLPCCSNYFQIAGLRIGYNGPSQLLKESLQDFATGEGNVDQYWIIEEPHGYHLPAGKVLVKTKDIDISLTEDSYILTWYFDSNTIKAVVSLDGQIARFYCTPPYDAMLREDLFHAFRAVFLIYAQRCGIFAIHSVSILHKDHAWLFSAASGTGKSTHATLWEVLFDTSILNGDLNLIHISESGPIVYGLPWCGTSDTYTTKAYPLGGITLLKQASSNHLQFLDAANKHLMVMQRLISPSWTTEMLDYNLSFSDILADITPIVHLHCTREPEAAILMKEYCDKTLSQTPILDQFN